LHTQRFWLEKEKRFISLKISRQGLRIIDKKGIEQVVQDLRARGVHV
jgi:large subunit ribosomal protein L28